MQPIKRGPAGTTIAAAVVHFCVVIATTALMMLGLLIAAAFSGLGSDSESSSSIGGELFLIALVVLVLAGAFVWCGVALLRRRNWARWVLVIAYGLALSAQVTAVAQTIGRGGHSYVYPVGPIVCGVLLVLLLHRKTQDDFATPTKFTVAPGSNGSAWRFWDGAAWTDATSPR
jgi:hypothetical protein